MVRLAVFSLAALALLGCRVTHPQGYDQLATPALLQPLPSTPAALRSGRMPDGTPITVDVERSRVHTGLGRYGADVAFTASSGGLSLRCATDPDGPGVPKTRFGCWSEGAPGITFWVAPDQDCPARNIAYNRTRRTPACWEGVLTTPQDTYTTAQAHLTGRGHAIERLTWTNAAAEVQQAADLVVAGRPRVYGTPDAEPELLYLHAFALQYWLHAIDPG